MKLKTSTKIMIAVCFLGLSLLLYPKFSDYWNSKHSTKAINTYIEHMEVIDQAEYQQIWEEARAYNRGLLHRDNSYLLSEEMKERYEKCLDVSGMGIMGYIEIPKLDILLPVYHGTSEGVLQHAIGHIEWSSLPTGGESTHSVLSGHRGLPSAKLFTDLNKLREGDVFTLRVLNEALTYEVDQIRTVEPREVTDLLIEDGRDYCTLVTCTPYGINSHRLLVRGQRIETMAVSNVHVASEMVMIDPLIVASVAACPFLLVLFMAVMLKKPEKKEENGSNL